MKKFGKLFCLITAVFLLLGGCGLGEDEDGARTALDFTVVEAKQVPEELKKVIEEHKAEEMQIVFVDQEDLYAVRGYGKQNTGGYSISVDECSEGENNIHLATTLIGPSPGGKISKDPSYPVIVVKLQNRDKEVEFE